MKVAVIFAFVLVCGLAYCEENNNNFEDETAELEDPKILRPSCKLKYIYQQQYLIVAFLFGIFILLAYTANDQKIKNLHVNDSLS